LNNFYQKLGINCLIFCFISFVVMIFPRLSQADELRIAVASNFYSTIKVIAERFEHKTVGSSGQQHKLILIPGSSGKHYAQILNGAPFDIFFSADLKHAKLLEQEGMINIGSRFTYAKGKLILWSSIDDYVDINGEVLINKDYRFLAIANPKLAPYGKSAEEVLRSLNLWENIQNRLVRGENIAQTFQFISSGNAELGFIAYSQIKNLTHPISGSFWEVPKKMYTPIEQQVVLIKDNDLARDFLTFIKSNEATSIIARSGYDLP